MNLMLSIEYFHKLMHQMSTIWPEITNQTRLKRYYSTVSDLEQDIVEKICNHFMDSTLKMPLPNDFAEASRLFKKSFFEKTGRYYNASGNKVNGGGERTLYQIECTYCCDSGFEFVKWNEAAFFVYCFCKHGDNAQKMNNWLLPKSADLKQMSRLDFPFSSFLPSKRDFQELECKIKMFKNELATSEQTFKALSTGE